MPYVTIIRGVSHQFVDKGYMVDCNEKRRLLDKLSKSESIEQYHGYLIAEDNLPTLFERAA